MLPHQCLYQTWYAIQIVSKNPSFQLDDSNWYLPNLSNSSKHFNINKDYNNNYLTYYFIFKIRKYSIENPISKAFKVLVYKNDEIIFQEETKTITLIP